MCRSWRELSLDYLVLLSIYLQRLASIQPSRRYLQFLEIDLVFVRSFVPRASPVKFARSPCPDPQGAESTLQYSFEHGPLR